MAEAGIWCSPYFSLMGNRSFASFRLELMYSNFMLFASSNFPSKRPDSSRISITLSFPSIVASQIGTTRKAANSKGPRIVMMMKDFFLTLVRYSRTMINIILCMSYLLFVYFGDKYFVKTWDLFIERTDLYRMD